MDIWQTEERTDTQMTNVIPYHYCKAGYKKVKKKKKYPDYLKLHRKNINRILERINVHSG